jgi:hypothetical protein
MKFFFFGKIFSDHPPNLSEDPKKSFIVQAFYISFIDTVKQVYSSVVKSLLTLLLKNNLLLQFLESLGTYKLT